MKFKTFFIVFTLISFASCKTNSHLYKIEGQKISITDSLQSVAEIEEFVKPYRDYINKDLDSVLAYSVDTYSKSDGELNTALGNLMADVVYDQANPVFKSRTGNNIDFVLINHGGIRSILSKGDVTTRTAFSLMPFENSIVIAKLNGSQVQELLNYLAEAKRAHPISKLQLVLDKNGNIAEASVKGTPIDFKKDYYVATNDYLYNGGDGMTFFKSENNVTVLDYKIRNALIDYFKKVDTISPVMDDRFIQIKD
uniref:5'-nucleotidase C-terminal domain-containing protein n=1 Tax=Gelidibacter sp. TaxID=2018083 RepID=UPI004048F674